MKTIWRVLVTAALIFDSAVIDILREKSAYKKRPLAMTWRDFWELAAK